MKIFADTNVLISAFSARGFCTDLIEVIIADHQLMTGEFVVDELQRVLTHKLKVPKRKVPIVMEFLRKHHVEPVSDNPSEVMVTDENNQWVLESAISAKAEILVIGDKGHLDFSDNVTQLKIISPRGFWELLQR